MNADERGCGQEERTAKSAKDAKVRTWTEQESETTDAETESSESRVQNPEFRVDGTGTRN